jgi:hypothetical protein
VQGPPLPELRPLTWRSVAKADDTKADLIARSVNQVLFDTRIPLGCLNRGVPRLNWTCSIRAPPLSASLATPVHHIVAVRDAFGPFTSLLERLGVTGAERLMVAMGQAETVAPRL